MENQNPTGLKQLMQSLCPDAPSVIEGRVTRASPLQITLVNDAKMILGENSLIVPKHLTNYTIAVDVSNVGLNLKTDMGGEHTHNEGKHDGHAIGDGSHTHVGGEHMHTISDVSVSNAMVTVHGELQQGETVYLLAFNNGKQYFVLGRR